MSTSRRGFLGALIGAPLVAKAIVHETKKKPMIVERRIVRTDTPTYELSRWNLAQVNACHPVVLFSKGAKL